MPCLQPCFQPCLQPCLRGRAVIVLNIQFMSWKNSHVVVQIQKERKVVLKENMTVAGVKARNKSKNAKPVSIILINAHYCHINVSAYLSLCIIIVWRVCPG